MHFKTSRWVTLIGAVALFGSISGCGGGGDAPPEAAKTAQVRVAALGFGAGLDRYVMAGNGDYAPGPSEFPFEPRLPTLTGLSLAGVALPPLTAWGATPYVTVPIGDYALPVSQAAVAQPISIREGARISLIRASDDAPWYAISEPQDVPLAATDAEISVLRVANPFGTDVAAASPIEISNAAGTVLKRLEGSTLLTSLRVPAGDIRITAFSLASAGASKRIFRSELISLPAGSRWLGSLFLDREGLFNVQLVNREGVLKVAVDQRARIRIVNMSDSAVTANYTSASQTNSTLSTVPYSIADFFTAGGESAVVRYSAQQSTAAMQTATLPQLLPGRGYDVVILNAPAPDFVRAQVVPHMQFVKGGPNCKDPLRVMNAIYPERSVSLGIVFSNFGSTDLQPARAATPSVIGPLQIALGDRGCSVATPPIVLLTVTDPATGVEQRVAADAGPAMRTLNALSSDLGMTLPNLVPRVNAVLDGSAQMLRWRLITP